MSNYLVYGGHVEVLLPSGFTPAQFDTTLL